MFLQYIFNGLAIGMAYALVAVGYSLVFGILRLINFSHGSVYTFGAHMTMMFIGFHWGAWYGVLASVILSGVLGVLINSDCKSDYNNRRILYHSEYADDYFWK